MANRPMQKYRGSCHCGAVRFEIETDFPELTTCDCSICRRKNALMVKVHENQFKLISGEDSLTEYRFHTMTARHFFCKTCGNMGTEKTCPHPAGDRVSLSGTQVREMLRAGTLPPPEFSRHEVASILSEAMRSA